MSIIEEALRRMEDPSGKGSGAPPPATAPPATPQASAVKVQQPSQPARAPEPAPRVHSWQPKPSAPARAAGPQNGPWFAVVGAVLVLASMLAVGGAFWFGRTFSANGPLNADVAVATPAATRSARPRPAPETSRTTKSTSLVLSGVVEGLGEPYAVINGLIVAAGERVSNTTLERIENGSVLLRRDDGREITLRVPR